VPADFVEPINNLESLATPTAATLAAVQRSVRSAGATVISAVPTATTAT
jgi:hypothetical protein